MSILQRKQKQGQGHDVPVHVRFMIDRLYLLLLLETHFEDELDLDMRYQAWMYQQIVDGLLADQAFRPSLEGSYAGLAGWERLQDFVQQCVQASDMGFYDGEIVVGLEHEGYETELAYCIARCDWSDVSADELPMIQQWYREGFHTAWHNPADYHPTTPSPYELQQDGRM